MNATVQPLRNIAAVFAILVAFACAPIQAQDAATRMVQGVVVDAAGAPAAKAVVHIKDTKTLQIRSYNTQDDGAYHFAGLSPNVDYELKAEREGASSGVKMVSVFDSRKTLSINLKLDKK